MSSGAYFDDQTGELVLTQAALDSVESRLLAASPGDRSSADEGWDAVVASGAFEPDCRPHPALTRVAGAIQRPALCRLALTYSGRAMRGWLSLAAAALAVPTDEARFRLVTVPVSLVPESLARAVDLAPRPRPATIGGFTQVEDVGDVRRRWQLSSSWMLEDGRVGGSTIDVVDSETGLWAVTSLGGREQVDSVTPTQVWRTFVRLIMRRDADGGAVWPPRRDGADSDA